jgi:hypothetical protein
MEHLEVLVEEPSTEAALLALLPRMLGSTSFLVHPYPDKHTLLARLPARLRGYAAWLPPTWRVLVVVDRDDDDCQELKRRLEDMARVAGLVTRSRAAGEGWAVVNRLAVEELEAWFFGDPDALHAAYPDAPAHLHRKAAFRDPDAITGGTREALERVLRRAGYFAGGLRKIEAARAIAPHMDPARNRSRSFQVLRAAVLEMVRT